MKKFILLLTVFSLIFASAHARNEKQKLRDLKEERTFLINRLEKMKIDKVTFEKTIINMSSIAKVYTDGNNAKVKLPSLDARIREVSAELNHLTKERIVLIRQKNALTQVVIKGYNAGKSAQNELNALNANVTRDSARLTQVNKNIKSTEKKIRKK